MTAEEFLKDKESNEDYHYLELSNDNVVINFMEEYANQKVQEAIELEQSKIKEHHDYCKVCDQYI